MNKPKMCTLTCVLSVPLKGLPVMLSFLLDDYGDLLVFDVSGICGHVGVTVRMSRESLDCLQS